MGNLFRRARYWISERKAAADLAEELEFHRAQLERSIESSGESPDPAAASRRAMGNATIAAEEARGVWIWPWLESVWQDTAYALRNLAAQPSFALMALLTLGVAIGLNTSLFTAFNALALRPWPVHDPNRVVNLFAIPSGKPKGIEGPDGFSIAEFRYLAEHSKTFDSVIAIRGFDTVKLAEKKIAGNYVSANFFRALGVRMELGRGFMNEEDRPQAPEPVAVLSYAAWQDRFGGDPEIVGKTVRLDDIPFIVVGVASRDFSGTSPSATDIWLPLSGMIVLRPQENNLAFLTSPNYCCSQLAARLADGVEPAQARAELTTLRAQFAAVSKQEPGSALLTGTALLSHPGRNKGTVQSILALMFTAVTLVLLLACANVGNLLIARAAARQREISIRLSIGASRSRIVRQLMSESLVLALSASVIGFALASWLPGFVVNMSAGPSGAWFRPDANVLAYSIALAVIACLAFGLAPALHATRPLSAGSRLTLRNILLSIQVAISVILLLAAGLMVRGIEHARALDPGFAIKEVTVVALDLPAATYSVTRKMTFLTQLEHDLEALPSAQPFGISSAAPLESSKHFTSIRKAGDTDKDNRIILTYNVSSGFFDVLGIPIVAGRSFDPSGRDRETILINEAAAKRFWPGEDPIGKMSVASGQTVRIIGVVKDAAITGLGEIEPTAYFTESGRPSPIVLIRNPAAAAAISSVAKHIDPRIEAHAYPLQENLDRSLAPSRIAAALAGSLGIFALILATIGIFGVFAYVVQQRTREIGIRMALGARPRQVVSAVLATNTRSLLVGLAAGLAIAMAGSRFLTRMLYGVSPFDPLAYTAVIGILAIAALAATIVPARRASRVDPMTALRWE